MLAEHQHHADWFDPDHCQACAVNAACSITTRMSRPRSACSWPPVA